MYVVESLKAIACYRNVFPVAQTTTVIHVTPPNVRCRCTLHSSLCLTLAAGHRHTNIRVEHSDDTSREVLLCRNIGHTSYLQSRCWPVDFGSRIVWEA